MAKVVNGMVKTIGFIVTQIVYSIGLYLFSLVVSWNRAFSVPSNKRILSLYIALEMALAWLCSVMACF